MAGSQEGNHYITYAFQVSDAINGKAAGGLPSVIAEELRRREQITPTDTLCILSGDKDSESLDMVHARIIAAKPETIFNPDKYEAWFSEWYAYLHPNGYSAKNGDPEMLQEMYRGEYISAPGTIERIREHFEKYGPLRRNPEATSAFNQLFDEAIQAIEPGSVINWQDFFFVDAILKHADVLQDKGCFQTFHLHTALPRELHEFEQGRQLLLAMSKMDTVYVHTDQYARNLVDQLERLNLPMPTIKRFDLGIDRRTIDQGLKEINKDNYKQRAEYVSLSDEQRLLIDEIFVTQEIIPHRFIDIDRLDPGKGTHIIFSAVDKFLSECGMTLDAMRANFRFFFVSPQINQPTNLLYDLGHQYVKSMREIATILSKKYPGVVYVSPEIPRIFISSALQNAHLMTGGIQDGLHLASQEAMYVNAQKGYDVSAIVGNGTGIAMQSVEDAPINKDLVYFTPAGNVDSVVDAISNIIFLKENHPGFLGEKTRRFVKSVLDSRYDSVVVSE